MKLTRRNFIKTAAAAALAPAVTGMAETPRAHEPLRELPYTAVHLTGGDLKRHYDAMHAHYLSLDNDRLLKVYRQRAGLPAPGEDMGGWYDLNGFVPGHSLGQYISGLARFGASTGDQSCHEKVHALVTGFGATLGEKNQSILRPATNQWPCYILDKHFIGLIDAASLSHLPDAIPLLNRVLSGAKSLLPARGHDRIGVTHPPYDETYVMPENLFIAHELTGNPEFYSLALRYLLDRELFDPLAHGGDPFPGQHAYSHVLALSSAAKAYLTSGEGKYHTAIENGWKLLTTEQQFASGGWGPQEALITPHKGELGASLETTSHHFETPCGSYAAIKLARYLIRTAAGPRLLPDYGDNLERVLWNGIRAAKHPDSNGDYFYYSAYSPKASKFYYPEKWPCCSGTLAQTVADYPLNIYFQSRTGIYINTYASSQLRWRQEGTLVTLTQSTRYPAENIITILLDLKKPTVFTLSMRIPGWAPSAATIAVNHEPPSRIPAGQIATLRNRWRAGDRITLTIPQDFRTEAIDEQHPETVALMRGPVQYVALNPPGSLGRDRLQLPGGLRQAAPETYVENYGGLQLIFVPFYRVANETYTSYFSRA